MTAASTARLIPRSPTRVLGRADGHPPGLNRGKGAAVREGMLRARGHHRAFTDADLSTPLEELERLRARLAGVPGRDRLPRPGTRRHPDPSAAAPRATGTNLQPAAAAAGAAGHPRLAVRPEGLHGGGRGRVLHPAADDAVRVRRGGARPRAAPRLDDRRGARALAARRGVTGERGPRGGRMLFDLLRLRFGRLGRRRRNDRGIVRLSHRGHRGREPPWRTVRQRGVRDLSRPPFRLAPPRPSRRWASTRPSPCCSGAHGSSGRRARRSWPPTTSTRAHTCGSSRGGRTRCGMASTRSSPRPIFVPEGYNLAWVTVAMPGPSVAAGPASP